MQQPGNIIGPGPADTQGKSEGINVNKFVLEQFIYNGTDNTFNLANTAEKILNIYIDNGVYPGEIPEGQTDEVTINQDLLLKNNKISIQYIKS